MYSLIWQDHILLYIFLLIEYKNKQNDTWLDNSKNFHLGSYNDKLPPQNKILGD